MSIANTFTDWLYKKQQQIKDNQSYKESLIEYEMHIKDMEEPVNTYTEKTRKYGKFDVITTIVYTELGPIIRRKVKDGYVIKSVIYEGYLESKMLKDKFGVSGYMYVSHKSGEAWNYGGKYFYSVNTYEVKALNEKKGQAIVESKTFIDDRASEYIGLAIENCFESKINSLIKQNELV